MNEISYPNFDIFVIHNGPQSNALPDALAQLSQNIAEIIDTGGNIGFSGGNNVGIRRALEKGADYVLLLNDDTEVSKDFLSLLVEIAEKRQDAGMFGPRIFFFDHPDKIWFDGAIFDPAQSRITFPMAGEKGEDLQVTATESDFITGCAVLVKRNLLEEIGLLNDFFFIYWEDVDWGLRAIKAGKKNLVVHNAHIWHKVTISMGGLQSPRTVYHKVRSHLLFTKSHAPKALLKLHAKFFRDVAWLFFKSKDVNRFKRVHAYIAAIRDYYMGKTDKGPDWLWR
jgi:GT2 family glycosyltransferase